MRIAVIGAGTPGPGMAQVAAIAEYLFRQLEQPHHEPPAILRQKVRAGKLGKPTGKGFCQWPKEPS